MPQDEARTGLQLRSLVKNTGDLELSLTRVPIPTPAPNEVLIRVEGLDIEPETILPSLTVEAGATLDLAIDQSVAFMRTELYGEATTTPSQERHLRTAAELFTRLTLSFILTPHTTIRFDGGHEIVPEMLMRLTEEATD